jgi:hypothetical protein
LGLMTSALSNRRVWIEFPWGEVNLLLIIKGAELCIVLMEAKA